MLLAVSDSQPPASCITLARPAGHWLLAPLLCTAAPGCYWQRHCFSSGWACYSLLYTPLNITASFVFHFYCVLLPLLFSAFTLHYISHTVTLNIYIFSLLSYLRFLFRLSIDYDASFLQPQCIAISACCHCITAVYDTIGHLLLFRFLLSLPLDIITFSVFISFVFSVDIASFLISTEYFTCHRVSLLIIAFTSLLAIAFIAFISEFIVRNR